MRPLSKAFYFGMFIAGFVLSLPPVVFLLYVFAEGRGRDREVIPFLMPFAFLPTVLGAIALLMLVYKMWAVIQDGQPRTTPGLATVLLIVPCVNLFWVFQAIWGWTKDFNRYAAERNIAAPRMPEGLALAYCILILLSAIPILGGCLALINIALLLIFMNAAINGVNAIIAAKAARTA